MQYFPRYSVVLNSNSIVLKVCQGKYLATPNFSCYICNTFPRYSVVLNSNSFVLKICPGKYLATPIFSCYITDDKIFSTAAAAVQSSLYHFPPLDQLLVLTRGKPTSPCLLITRLRAGNVLWSRNSFSEKERHLTRVQHG